MSAKDKFELKGSIIMIIICVIIIFIMSSCEATL